MDDLKEVKIIAGAIIGLGVVAAGIYWFVTSHSYLVLLLNVLAGLGVVYLIGRASASLYWAFKGPRPLYESEQKRLAALVDRDGQIEMMPHSQYPAGLTSLSYHNDPYINAPQMPAIAAPVINAAPTLPQARSIYEVAPLLHGVDKVLLGYDERGPSWLEINDLLSIAMAGNSGRGKSRALLWLVLQFLRLRQPMHLDTRILDGKADLRKWLGAFYPVAYTPAEIQQTVDEAISLIEHRLDQDSRTPGSTFPPLLIVMDELDMIAGRYAKVTTLVELLTKKSRSVNVHGIYSNQSVPADLVGGVKTRGVIVSRICFYCDDEAARLIGVRKDNGGAELLQRIGPPAPQGLAVVRTAAFGWKLIAFPFVPDTAISFLLDGLNPLPPLPAKTARMPYDSSAVQDGYTSSKETTAVTSPGSPFSALPEPPPDPHQPGATAAMEKKQKQRYTEAERQEVLRLHFREGVPASRIHKLIGKDSNFYYDVRDILAEAKAQAEAQAQSDQADGA